MGGANYLRKLTIITIGGDQNIINQLFPEFIEDSNQSKIKYTKRQRKENHSAKKYEWGTTKDIKIDIFWESYNFPDINQDNENDIIELIENLFDIHDEEEETKNDEEKKINNSERNNIIIKFGENNIDILIKFMNFYSRAFLPQFAIVTNKDITINLFDNRFLAIIRDNSQVEKAIFSYIWEKDCYFNQRGCLIDELSPKNLSFDEISSTTSLNIMLTGMSRAGKSTLINVLSKKFVALETPNPESVTTEINEYIIYKKIGDYKVRFKFIDTPGLIVDKKINTIDLLKDLITKKLKEYDDSNDSIHIIYFMTAAIPNFESIKQFFQFLENLNDERKKKNKPTIPILFINNRNTGNSDLDGIRQFLKSNYKFLYQSFKKEENKPKLSFKEKFKKKNNENEMKDNVLGVNLLKDKDENGNESKVFGINKILIATKYMIKQTNPFNEEDFRKLEELVNFIKQSHSTQDTDLSLKNEITTLLIKISKENSLLEKYKSVKEIIKKIEKEVYIIIYVTTSLGFIVGLIPVPFLDIPILYSVNSIMILKIASCYNIQKEEIPKSTYAKLIFGIECNVESSIRTLGNGAGVLIGKDIGKDFVGDLGEHKLKEWTKSGLQVVKSGGKVNIAKNVESSVKAIGNGASMVIGKDIGKDLVSGFGEHQLKDWTKSGLNAVKSGVNVNIAKEAEKLTVKDGQSFFQYLYHLMPSFKSGINKGVEEGSEQLGKKLGEAIIENSSKTIEKTVVKEAGENAGKTFSKTITTNLNKFFNATKIVPIFGSLIGGVLDSHSVYTTGKNAMNFFNNYLGITNGGEYVLKKKKDYEKIFETMDLMKNEDYENFEKCIFSFNEQQKL